MNHAYIEENALVDRYVANKLSSAERAAFEDHFIGCGECQRQLQIAGKFANAYRRVANINPRASLRRTYCPPSSDFRNGRAFL